MVTVDPGVVVEDVGRTLVLVVVASVVLVATRAVEVGDEAAAPRRSSWR